MKFDLVSWMRIEKARSVGSERDRVFEIGNGNDFDFLSGINFDDMQIAGAIAILSNYKSCRLTFKIKRRKKHILGRWQCVSVKNRMWCGRFGFFPSQDCTSFTHGL